MKKVITLVLTLALIVSAVAFTVAVKAEETDPTKGLVELLSNDRGFAYDINKNIFATNGTKMELKTGDSSDGDNNCVEVTRAQKWHGLQVKNIEKIIQRYGKGTYYLSMDVKTTSVATQVLLKLEGNGAFQAVQSTDPVAVDSTKWTKVTLKVDVTDEVYANILTDLKNGINIVFKFAGERGTADVEPFFFDNVSIVNSEIKEVANVIENSSFVTGISGYGTGGDATLTAYTAESADGDDHSLAVLGATKGWACMTYNGIDLMKAQGKGIYVLKMQVKIPNTSTQTTMQLQWTVDSMAEETSKLKINELYKWTITKDKWTEVAMVVNTETAVLSDGKTGFDVATLKDFVFKHTGASAPVDILYDCVSFGKVGYTPATSTPGGSTPTPTPGGSTPTPTPTPKPAYNLLTNGSFKQDVTEGGWSSNGVASIYTADSQDGDGRCAMVVRDANYKAMQFRVQDIMQELGEGKYTFSVWIKIKTPEVGENVTYKYMMFYEGIGADGAKKQWYDNTETSMSEGNVIEISSNGWTKMSITVDTSKIPFDQLASNGKLTLKFGQRDWKADDVKTQYALLFDNASFSKEGYQPANGGDGGSSEPSKTGDILPVALIATVALACTGAVVVTRKKKEN